MRGLFLAFMLLFAGLVQAQPFENPFGNSSARPDFLPVGKAFEFSSQLLASGQTRLHWRIADGYYLYQQRLKFDGLPAALHPPLPAGVAHSDEFFGHGEVYRGELELLIPAGANAPVKIGWQGCADAGLCYPPQSADIQLSAISGTGTEATDLSLANTLQQGSLGWGLLIFFGLGLLLAFTPCSLPMLPILAGLVLGNGASTRRGWALAGCYVLSMALVYASLGVAAAMLGGNLQAMLQQPWLLGTLAALFVLLALPMFGVFELQLPAFVRDRLELAGRQQRGGSLVGAALLGVLSGLLVGPCMTAPLAGALLYIAQTGNAVHGGLILFGMGLGMGLPLLLLVTLGNRYLPRPGAWMNLVKGLFGFVFLGMALYMLRTVLEPALLLGLCGALLASLAHAIWSRLPRTLWLQPLAIVLGLWGALMVIGAAAGAHDPWRPLQVFGASASADTLPDDGFLTIKNPRDLQRELDAAKAQGQWVLLDYYADWCVSCKIMEKQVFAKDQVLAALDGVRLLRLDVTADGADSRQLLERYQVPGPPSLLWIGPDGSERRSQRVTGEVDARTFVQHWTATRTQG